MNLNSFLPTRRKVSFIRRLSRLTASVTMRLTSMRFSMSAAAAAKTSTDSCRTSFSAIWKTCSRICGDSAAHICGSCSLAFCSSVARTSALSFALSWSTSTFGSKSSKSCGIFRTDDVTSSSPVRASRTALAGMMPCQPR